MSNPKRPSKLKLIAGTSRSDRPEVEPVALPVLKALPGAPDWLPNAHAVKEWERLAPILYGVGLLTEAGLSALGMLCALHGKLVQLWAAGEAPNAAMLASYRNLVNDFGLTPVAQGKVKTSGEKETENKFSKFGKRHA